MTTRNKTRILLLGGTSETAPLAQCLAETGYRVLVSTATGAPLNVGEHPNIERRNGPLDLEALRAYIRENAIRAVVDAAHPYANAAHQNARKATGDEGIPCLRFLRPASYMPTEGSLQVDGQTCFANTHEEAATQAFDFDKPVLLTTGSRNLTPYAQESRRTGVPLTVRVLPEAASLEACRAAGIAPENTIAARGPFSLDDNLTVIRERGIGVLVTKDTGDAGGFPEKIAAARREQCAVVILRRPEETSKCVFQNIENLLDFLRDLLPITPKSI